MKYQIIIFTLFFQSIYSQNKSLDTINDFTINICNYSEVENKKPIELDWVDIDRESIKKLNKLYTKFNTLEDIQRVFPNFISGEGNFANKTYDCGYNLKTSIHQDYGGYGSIYISALYFENKILKIRFTIDIDREIVFNYLKADIKFVVECKNDKLTFDKIIESNVQEYIKKHGDLYLVEFNENSKKAEALSYFNDVLHGSKLEEPYYILNGLDSPTFDYIRFFIVSKDFASLKNLIYSPSPTARLLIANTILYLNKNQNFEIDDKLNNRINEIIKTDQKIKSGIISCWINKFEYDFYDVNNNFENYLYTK
ncbi:hypothetical protein [Flavobacterium chungnamense]|uniref:Uncharacterized protein n=1 Tax=Flavobacterium chungnamense TaxID=706182 RepID=A0ABP7UTV4_9FLAO